MLFLFLFPLRQTDCASFSLPFGEGRGGAYTSLVFSFNQFTSASSNFGLSFSKTIA